MSMLPDMDCSKAPEGMLQSGLLGSASKIKATTAMSNSGFIGTVLLGRTLGEGDRWISNGRLIATESDVGLEAKIG